MNRVRRSDIASLGRMASVSPGATDRAAEGRSQVPEGNRQGIEGLKRVTEGMREATEGAKKVIGDVKVQTEDMNQVAEGRSRVAEGGNRVPESRNQVVGGRSWVEEGRNQGAGGGVAEGSVVIFKDRLHQVHDKGIQYKADKAGHHLKKARLNKKVMVFTGEVASEPGIIAVGHGEGSNNQDSSGHRPDNTGVDDHTADFNRNNLHAENPAASVHPSALTQKN